MSNKSLQSITAESLKSNNGVPNGISFEVRDSSGGGTNYSLPRTWTWDTVVHDEGNGFDLSTDTYTPPVDGYYYMEAAFMHDQTYGTPSQFRPYFLLNGTRTNARGRFNVNGGNWTAYVAKLFDVTTSDSIQAELDSDSGDGGIVSDAVYMRGYLVAEK